MKGGEVETKGSQILLFLKVGEMWACLYTESKESYKWINFRTNCLPLRQEGRRARMDSDPKKINSLRYNNKI